MAIKPMYIACPDCGDVIGGYNKDIEKNRKEQGFKSYCTECEKAVKPIYI